MRPDQLCLGNGLMVCYSRGTDQVYIQERDEAHRIIADILIELDTFRAIAKWVEKQQRWDD